MKRIVSATLIVGSLALFGTTAARAGVADLNLVDEVAAPLLTPLEEIIEIDTTDAEALADGGVVVLDEEIRVVAASAARVTLLHQVFKPTTEAGIELLSPYVLPYNRAFQTVELITARTISADGAVTDIDDEASFIQSPQEQADQGIYTDVEELVVLFSNVKVGSLVEYVIAIETPEARMPGAWTTVLYPQGFWPTARLRQRVEIEDPLSDRLRIIPVGKPRPSPIALDGRAGWRTLEWRADSLPPLQWEIDRAPTSQYGPAFRLTTVESWNDVAAWYNELLASRSSLGPDLAAEAESWIAGVDEPREIVEILHRKVADEIRYTGLEFGMGAYRPRSPDDVWSSQYGDCKDKANLLRVLLGHAGISSSMLLVNTEHAGRIEPDAPGANQFNHTILLVELDDTTMLCDPTVASLPAGELPASDTDRDGLLITPEGGEIIRIPSRVAGTVGFSFDLDVATDGSLTGWLEISADRSRGAAYSHYFRHLDESSRRSSFFIFLDAFYAGAELVDLEVPALPSADFKARVYFAVAGSSTPGGGSAVLRFPHGDLVLPHLGDNDERHTPWHQPRKTDGVVVRYRLPPGWAPQGPLPHPLSVTSPSLEAEASWSSEDGALVGRLEASSLTDLVEPDEFSRFRQGVTALSRWIDVPVAVAATTDVPADLAPVAVEMPLMPTGAGQLRLVDRLFPVDGDRERRRSALLQTQQLFPDSAETVFDAHVWLAQLDAIDGRPELAADRVEQALASHGNAQTRENLAWARYHLAGHLAEAGELDRALALFEQIATDEAVSHFRRAAAYEMLGSLHADADLDRALDSLDAGLVLDSGLESDLHDLRARLLVQAGASDRLETSIDREMAADPSSAQGTIDALAATVRALRSEGSAGSAAALAAAVLRIAAASPHAALDETRRAELETIARTAASYQRIAAEIRADLEDGAFPWLDEVADEVASGSLAELDASLARFDREGRLPQYVRGALMRLADHQESLPAFGQDLWELAMIVEANRPDDELLARLIDWGLDLPHGSDDYYEMLFLKQRWLERGGRTDDAIAMVEQHCDDPAVPVNFRVAFLSSLGGIYERQQRWRDALECYRRLEPDRDTNLIGYDALLRAALINLDLGEIDEALRLIGLLSDLTAEELAYCDNPEQIDELVGLAARPEIATRFWQLERDWWPVWQSLERAVGLEPAPDVVIALIPDLEAALLNLQRAAFADAPITFFERYRSLIQAARWQPELVFQAISLADEAARMSETEDDLVDALVMALASGLDIGDADLYKRSRVQLATHYVDSGLYPAAVAVGREYLGRFEPDDDFGRAMVRLWGLAASHSGIDAEAATTRLEQLLDSSDLTGSRTVTVYVLDSLYRSLGRTDDEVALIEREILNGTIDNEHYGEQLKRRHGSLAGRAGRESELDAALDEWFDRFRPAWYATAAPSSLDDPEAGRIEQGLSARSAGIEATEAIKLRLLTARDTDRPIDTREQSFVFACDDLEALFPTYSEADALLEAVVTDDRLTKENRDFLLWMALARSRDAGHRNRILRWTEGELLTGWSDDERRRYAEFAAIIPPPTSTVDELAETGRELVRGTLTDDDVRALRFVHERLLELGAFEIAGSLIDDLGSAGFDVRFELSGAALRLELKRRLRAHRIEQPANEAMRSVVLEALDGDFLEPPPNLDDVRDFRELDHLDRERALAIRLHLLAARRFDVPSTGFWIGLLDDLRDLHGQELARRTLTAGVAAAADDELRSRLLLYPTFSAFDVDEPADRDRIAALAAAATADPSMRLSRAAAALIAASVAARTGEPFNPDTVDEAAAVMGVEMSALRLRLARAMQLGRPQLKHTLQSIPVERLVEPGTLPFTLPGLRATGLTDEAELVAEVAREEARDALLESWSTLQGFPIRRVLRLCRALEEEDCIVPEWRDDMIARIGRRELVLDIELADAELRGSWAAARRAAAELVELRPTFYDLYWRLGRAEANAGNTEAARQALAVFLEHCRDSVDLDEAARLLSKLELR